MILKIEGELLSKWGPRWHHLASSEMDVHFFWCYVSPHILSCNRKQ